MFSVNSNNNTNNLNIGVSRGRLDADIFRNGNVSNGSSRRDIGDSLSVNNNNNNINNDDNNNNIITTITTIPKSLGIVSLNCNKNLDVA